MSAPYTPYRRTLPIPEVVIHLKPTKPAKSRPTDNFTTPKGGRGTTRAQLGIIETPSSVNDYYKPAAIHARTGLTKRWDRPGSGPSGHPDPLRATQSAPPNRSRLLHRPLFEVEAIWAKRIVKHKAKYWLKWKGWDASTNTWEPATNLIRCPKVLARFEESPFTVFCARDNVTDLIILLNDNSIPPHLVKSLLSTHALDPLRTLGELPSIPRPLEVLKPTNVKEFERLVSVDNTPPIYIVNTIDAEGPPHMFSYITKNVYAEGVFEPDPNFLHHCTCVSCDMKAIDPCGCSTDCNGHAKAYAYGTDGLLRADFDRQAIFECNVLCECGGQCPNRVVQRGRTERLCIMRISGDKGWGVVTLDPLKRGQFIMEYVGEVITSECAEVRARAVEYGGNSYLFDLDFGATDEQREHIEKQHYTIDAKHRGNVSHFVNHSCTPNMAAHAVYIESQDSSIHRIAFFAKRDVKVGEELCFDYAPQAGRKKQAPKNRVERKCFCGAKSCRGWLPV